MEETLAMLALGNSGKTPILNTGRANSAPIGPAQTIVFDDPAPYLPHTTGQLRLDASFAVVGSAVDIPVSVQPRVAGAVDASANPFNSTCGHVTAEASGATVSLYPCTKGVAISLGVQAATSGGNTLTGTAQLIITEMQTS